MFDAAGLEDDGEDDQREAEPERPADFARFVEQERRQGDAVHGLQVVGEVDGEGRQLAQRLELEEEGDDGKDGTEEDEPEPVAGCRNDRLGRQDSGLNREAEGQEEGAAGQFPEQHRRAVFAGAVRHVDVAQGKDGVEGRGQQAQRDAEPVADVEAEDQLGFHPRPTVGNNQSH